MPKNSSARPADELRSFTNADAGGPHASPAPLILGGSITRRNAMNMIAKTSAIVAVTLPATAVKIAGEDRELLSLGAALDDLYSRFAVSNAADLALVEEGDRQMAPHVAKYELDRGVDLWELTKATWAEVGRDGLEVQQIGEAMDAPMNRVMSLPAQTVAGLGVKAKVAAFACSHFWNDDDYDKKAVCSFIESVLAFAGQGLPFAEDEDEGEEDDRDQNGLIADDYATIDFGAFKGFEDPGAEARFEENLDLFVSSARAMFRTMSRTRAELISKVDKIRCLEKAENVTLETVFNDAERFARSIIESFEAAKRRYAAAAASVALPLPASTST